MDNERTLLLAISGKVHLSAWWRHLIGLDSRCECPGHKFLPELENGWREATLPQGLDMTRARVSEEYTLFGDRQRMGSAGNPFRRTAMPCSMLHMWESSPSSPERPGPCYLFLPPIERMCWVFA